MKIELYHDILAREIYDLASAEEKMRLKVERYVRERYAFYKERRALLSQEDLDYIQPYLDDLDLHSEQQQFVARSRKALSRATARRRIYIAGLLLILLLLGTAIWQWNRAERNAGAARQQADRATVERDNANQSRREAEEQRTLAELARDSAEYYREEAETKAEAAVRAEQEARFAELEAELARARAEESEQSAQQQRTANRLTAEALDIREKNPTLALQLAHHACELIGNDNELATRTRDEIFRTYNGTFCRRTFHGYTTAIDQVAFSKDGLSVLASSTDPLLARREYGYIRSWSVDGQDHEIVLDHIIDISATAFSSDRAYLLTGSQDGRIVLWDREGRALQHFRDSTRITSLAFSPDGRLILSNSWESVKLWDRSGALIREFGPEILRASSMTFSPDGRQLLSAHNDGQVRLWNLDGTLINTFEGHTAGVNAAVFSPDGSMILSAGEDGAAKLWRLDGTEVNIFRGNAEGVATASFSTDGNLILTGHKDGAVKVWDQGGRVLRNFVGHAAAVTAVSFSKDGNRVLTGDAAGLVKLWDLEHPQIPVPRDPVVAGAPAVYTPDGQTIVAAGAGNSLSFWTADGDHLRSVTRHRKAVTALAVSSSGRYLLSGSADSTVLLWSIDGRLLFRFPKLSDEVKNVGLAADEQTLFAASKDGTARVWNRNGEEKLVIQSPINDKFNCFSLSPDGGRLLAGGTDDTVSVWDIRGELLHRLALGGAGITGIRTVGFASDGSFFFAGSFGGIDIWDEHGQPISSFKSFRGQDQPIIVSPDGRYLLCVTMEDEIVLYDVQGNVIETYNNYPTRFIRSLAFSPSGDHFLVGLDGTLFIWDRKGPIVHSFESHYDRISTVAVAPDGKTILTGGSDGDASVRLWKMMPPGEQLQIFRGHTDRIDAVVYSPDGQLVLTAGSYNTLILWDAQTGQLRKRFKHSTRINDLAFSPDGTTFLAGDASGKILVWDLNGKLLHAFAGHQGWRSIFSVAFTPDGRSVFTAAEFENTVKRWDLQTQSLIQSFTHDHNVNSMALSPGGQYLLTGTSWGVAKLWTTEGQLVATLRSEKGYGKRGQGIRQLAFSNDGKYTLVAYGEGVTIIRDLAGNTLQTINGTAIAFHPQSQHLILQDRYNSHRIFPNLEVSLKAQLYQPLTASEKLAYGIQQPEDFLTSSQWRDWIAGIDFYLEQGKTTIVQQIVAHALKASSRSRMMTAELIRLARFYREKIKGQQQLHLFENAFAQTCKHLLGRVKVAMAKEGLPVYPYDLADIYELYLSFETRDDSVVDYLRQALQKKLEMEDAALQINTAYSLVGSVAKERLASPMEVELHKMYIELMEGALNKDEKFRTRVEYLSDIQRAYRGLATHYLLTGKQGAAITAAERGLTYSKNPDWQYYELQFTLLLAHLYHDQYDRALVIYEMIKGNDEIGEEEFLQKLEDIEEELGKHPDADRLRSLLNGN